MKAFTRVIGPAEYEFKEKRSLFRATLAPVEAVEQATAFWASLKEKYREATHNCPAWRLPDGEEFCSDDGEPGGTAGRPILGEIRRGDLFGCALVVTRWFGGVKLGPRGLIEAYSAAAAGALSAAATARSCYARRFTLTVGYEDVKTATHLLGSLPLAGELRTCWAQSVTLSAPVALDDLPVLQSAFSGYQWSTLLQSPPLWSGDELVTLA